MFHLNRTQEVDAPLEIVFGFFSRPENLQLLTPPSMKMQVLTPEAVPMHTGSIIDYVVTVSGLPMRWTSCIAQFEPMTQFVDVQLRGPYSFWHHSHAFEGRGDKTLVHDRIVYALPLGPLGKLAHRLFVRRQLEHIFSYRQAYLEQDVCWATELWEKRMSKNIAL